MSTLAEIDNEARKLPRAEIEALVRRLSAKLDSEPLLDWPVPPPDVPREEIERIQARIDEAFGHVGQPR